MDAFEKDNNPNDFITYMNVAFSKQQIKSELLNSDSEFHFVYRNEKLVGYFKICENTQQGEPFGNDALELSRIYVLKEFQGQGLGEIMLQQIINFAQDKQKTWLWLGVWQLNVSAVRFYERHGFTKFDTHSFFIGNDRQTDWLMRLDVI
jgi:ribosomal protein S18 acetylase RimI-like enzyme